MDNNLESKRIEEQRQSPSRVHSDVAKMRETKELSTKLSSLERKLDEIGRVVYSGKNKIQKIAEDVQVIRSEGDTELSVITDRSDSLCDVIVKMHDSLQSIREVCERMHLEVFGYTSPRAEAVPEESAEDQANRSGTSDRIVDGHHPAMEDHVKKMEHKLANYCRVYGMGIKSYARKMTKIHEEIEKYGGKTSPAILKHNFIKGLGREFDQVLVDLIHETLPPEWQPFDLGELVPVAIEYLDNNCLYRPRKRKHSDSDDNSD